MKGERERKKEREKTCSSERGDDGGGPSGPRRDLGASLSLVILPHSTSSSQHTSPPATPDPPPSVLPTENVDSRLPVPRSLVDTTSFSWHRQARQINI